eukprot:1020428-Amphidinium_carterae.1
MLDKRNRIPTRCFPEASDWQEEFAPQKGLHQKGLQASVNLTFKSSLDRKADSTVDFHMPSLSMQPATHDIN